MKVAVVTGANKGIGFEIVKGLCKQFDGVVYLTARDVTRGQNAVAELIKLGYRPKFHQLDVTDKTSIEQFRDHLKSNYGGLDILVNNAGVLYHPETNLTLIEQAENTTFMNYFSLISVCDTLKPVIRNGGRIVNVSSGTGHLSRIPGKELKEKFSKKDLTTPELSSLVRQYVDAVKAGTAGKEGWPDFQKAPYVVSKVAVSTLSFIQQHELASRARDVTRGQNAVEELIKLGLNPKFHQLNIAEKTRIEIFWDHLKSNYGGLDVLVNNAGVLYLLDTDLSLIEQAEKTTFVNYFSLISICDILKPIIRNGGRIVNIGCSSGHLSSIPSKELKDKFNKEDLTTSELSNLVRQFVDAVKAGTTGEEGWPDFHKAPYVVSKVAVSALTFILQRELASREIKVNAVHPGYITTDMTKTMPTIKGAPEAKAAGQGAEAPLYLTLEAPDNEKGVYMWHDKTIIPWHAEKTPAIC